MTVDLRLDPPGVTLVEPEDCARFDVVAFGGGTAADLDRVLIGASVGRMVQDEAMVTVAAVRRLASGSVGDGWEADFTAMLEFARVRGWISEGDDAIRAHVEWR